MKIPALLGIAFLAFGLATGEADAARRFGGGSSLGKQRPAPMQKQATPAPATPAQAAPATPAAAPAAPAPQTGFMGRWGGMIAGLGIGALIGSLFGGHLGGMGGILMLLAVAGLAFMAFRAFASRRQPAAAGAAPARFQGLASDEPSRAPLNIGAGVSAPATEAAAAAVLPAGFEAEPFLRVAKTSFIRLQAANDAKDLDDIRDFTTPEMFAEISMQIGERGDAPQRTEVVSVNASLVEAVVEGDHAIASVRFVGLIRETAGANPEPFDETWHVRKSETDRKATWLIAGIQQNG